MGLDIYFHRVRRIDEKSTVHTEVAYFRKVNFLMSYFAYKGNCEEINVTLDQIKELVARCEKVLETRSLAPKLLPTQDGFFFGSTEYNDWYLQDVREVRDTFRKVLKDDTGDSYTMYCWW